MWHRAVWSTLAKSVVTLVLLASFAGRAQAQAVNRVALLGSVLSALGERPIAGARVQLIGTASEATTDSLGLFALWDITPGRHRLLIRALGFAPLDLPLIVPPEGLDGLDVLLATTLAQVDINARVLPRELHLRRFDERRRTGMGRFLDSTVLHKSGPLMWASRMAAHIPFMQIAYFSTPTGSGHTFVGRQRGTATLRGSGPSRCYPMIIADNVLYYGGRRGEPLLDITFLTNGPPVVAAEYYTQSQVPAEFDRGGAGVCGAIVLWTKR